MTKLSTPPFNFLNT